MAYKIRDLYIYPIKGIAGIAVKEAYAEEMGFRNDRRMLLVDKEGVFLSQRTHPKLSQIHAMVNASNLVVSHGQDQIVVDESKINGEPIEAKVWEHQIKSYEVDKNVSNWFSDILGDEVRLVARGPDSSRKKTFLKHPYESEVSYADGYPYLGIGTASIKDFSERLGLEINAIRFRPNIVFETEVPYEEDTFDHLSVNDVKLRGIKPCARCQVVNIDPDTGISDKQYLKALSTYRKIDNNVYIGINMICREPGILKVGDSME